MEMDAILSVWKNLILIVQGKWGRFPSVENRQLLQFVEIQLFNLQNNSVIMEEKMAAKNVLLRKIGAVYRLLENLQPVHLT